MAHPTAKRIVRAVLDAREKKMSDAAVVERLQELGIPSADAPALIESVVQGFKAGNAAVITGGLSSVDLPLGQSPIFDCAFRRGKSALRFTTPAWVLLRLVGPWLLLALAIGAIVYVVVT